MLVHAVVATAAILASLDPLPSRHGHLLPLALMPNETLAEITLELKTERIEELHRAIRRRGFDPLPRPERIR